VTENTKMLVNASKMLVRFFRFVQTNNYNFCNNIILLLKLVIKLNKYLFNYFSITSEIFSCFKTPSEIRNWTFLKCPKTGFPFGFPGKKLNISLVTEMVSNQK